MYDSVSCKLLCKKDYTKEEVDLFKVKIDEEYSINLLVDNLPAATHVSVPNSASTYLAYDRGFRVGGTIRVTGAGADKVCFICSLCPPTVLARKSRTCASKEKLT